MKGRKGICDPIIWVLLFSLCFYFYIASQVPYTGDDWDWGLEIGLQHLLTADINSRYAGNFFAVIMTRSKLVQVLVMGISYFLIPFLMTAIVTEGNLRKSRKHAVITFLITNCLLLSMDASIWQQTYGWVSGFANYGISLVFIAIYLYLVLPLFQEAGPARNMSRTGSVFIFLLSIIIQLFLENLSVCMVFLSATLSLVSYLRSKKISRMYRMSLAGSFAGILIMFSSNIYPALFSTGTTLGNGRKLAYDLDGGIISMIKGCFASFSKEIATMIWENNLVICCSISVLLILLWFQKADNTEQWRKGNSTLRAVMIAIDALSIPYFVVFSYLEYGKYFLRKLQVQIGHQLVEI